MWEIGQVCATDGLGGNFTVSSLPGNYTPIITDRKCGQNLNNELLQERIIHK